MYIYTKIIMRISLRIDTHFKDLTLRLPESMSGTHGIWSFLENIFGEGNGTPLQYSCLENPMGGGAWWAAVHGSLRVGHD